jgi:PAS domain S-box-containing protein
MAHAISSLIPAAQLLVLAALAASLAALYSVSKTLRTSELRNIATLSALPDLIFVFDKDGTYLDCRARHTSLLLLPPAQLIGRQLSELLPPELTSVFKDAIAKSLASDEPVILEYALEKHGDKRDYETRLVRCAPGQVLTVVRDVTEARRAERSLKASEAALRASNLENLTLVGRLIEAQEAERQRIARDMHDDLGQKLALLGIEIERLNAPASDHRPIEGRVQGLSRYLAEIAHDVHALSHELHPSKLETLGFLAAVRSLGQEMMRQYDIEIDVQHAGSAGAVDPNIALHLYRIIQEALHNVRKHSGARHAFVRLEIAPDIIDLQVADSGCGFDGRRIGHPGLGLVSMRERVRLLNGQIVIHTAPGEGTRLGVRVPIDCGSVGDDRARAGFIAA